MKTEISALKGEYLILKKGEATQNYQPSNKCQDQYETNEEEPRKKRTGFVKKEFLRSVRRNLRLK